MKKAIKIAQMQKFATKQRMTNKTIKNLQLAWKSIIYADCTGADSTGADSSGADNKVSKALFMHSFPRSGPKD